MKGLIVNFSMSVWSCSKICSASVSSLTPVSTHLIIKAFCRCFPLGFVTLVSVPMASLFQFCIISTAVSAESNSRWIFPLLFLKAWISFIFGKCLANAFLITILLGWQGRCLSFPQELSARWTPKLSFPWARIAWLRIWLRKSFCVALVYCCAVEFSVHLHQGRFEACNC